MLGGCSAESTDICLDNSGACVQRRLKQFETMRQDPAREWISSQPGVGEYASGVRLFAYRATSQELSCVELRKGIAETARARHVLAPGNTAGMSAERIGQIIALSDEVNAELKRNQKQRCR